MKASIRTAGHSILGAVCMAAVLLMTFSVPAQNLFEADWSDTISEFTPNGVKSTFVASGLSIVNAMAFNSAGDLFAGETEVVVEFTPGGVKSTFASGLTYPDAMAFNSAGELFVWVSQSGIIEITPSGRPSTFKSGSGTGRIVFDSAGDLFVSYQAGGRIYETSPGGVLTTFASGLDGPRGLAFNSKGNLFEADNGSGNVYEFTNNSGTLSSNPTVFASGLGGPTELAIDADDDVFVASGGSSGTITKITPNGTQSTFASGLNITSSMAFQPVPKLSAVGLADNDKFQLTVSMPSPYYTTVLQASTNMANWVNIYTNTPPFSFTDSMSECPIRFYRAVLDTNFY